ncbi:cytochrome P450 1A5-like [Clytia hemisphaerica]|uniref:Uncharacterized protein n=1 Tax=Clytia hemisphaerica TaxID=252671 RepID=A0A7M5VAA5_9CNID
MIPAVVSIALFIVLTITFSFKTKRGKFLPPGPSGLPIIGYLHKLGSKPLHLLLADLGETYGDIFSLQLGSRLTVILNSKDAVYETFVKKAKIFAGRPDLATFTTTRHGATGISMCDYTDEYKRNRQMTLKAMHSLYADKERFNEILQHEATKMINLFNEKSLTNERFDPANEFHKVVPSIMVHVMYGKNSPYDDKDVMSLVNVNKRWFQSAEGSNPADFLKFLERFPNKRLDAIQESCMMFYKFAFQKMEEYEQQECSGLYGTYIQLYKEKTGVTELTNKDRFELGRCVNDMLGGGFDTLAATLTWALLYLWKRPEVIAKCREEIERVLSDEDMIGLHHEKQLSYCMATTHELLRVCSVAPLGLPRKTMEEVKIGEFVIPKDTMVMPNLWSINNQTELWKNAEQFSPENFLDEEGHLELKSIRNIATFSVGVRRCPGEKFATLQLFVLLTNYIKNFNFDVCKPPQDMIPQGGLTLQAKPFMIKVSKVDQ